MNTIFTNKNVITGYVPCYNTDLDKEATAICLIEKNDIIASNDDILTTKNLIILNIIDKHFNEYTSAVTIYDADAELLLSNKINLLNSPIIVYKNIKSANQVIKLSKSIRVRQYDNNVHLIRDGVITNGFFNGMSMDKKYKDGILFISP